jgi:uncharacterized protein (TIGR03000 family)
MKRSFLPALLAVAAAGAALAQQAPNDALIVVRVPADATLTVGGQETTSRGSERRFVSPDLTPGSSYSYELVATWQQGGKEMKVTRTVSFRAGQIVTIDLRSAAPQTALKGQPKKVDAKKTEVKTEPKKGDMKLEAKTAKTPGDEPGFVSLFNGKDLSGWKTVPEKAEATYTVKDGAIIVSGNPSGYFYTDKSYQNYVLRFDWRYKRPANLEDENKFGGNSGLLVHIQEPHKVWPKSLEVQGMNRDHGSLIGIGVKVSNSKFDRVAMEKARNKVGEWNTTEATINGNSVTVKVNGVQVTTGNFALPGGPFGFQSEGAELHFKNIRIKTLPATPGPPPGKKATEPKAEINTKKLDSGPKKAPTLAAAGDGFKDLFNGKNLDGWKVFLDPKAKEVEPAKTFVVKDGEIQVTGFPNGYFYTDKSFKNYVIQYDWTYPKDQPEKTSMNSGLLVHIQEPHTIWPKSVEPQGRYKDHAKMFFPGFPKDGKPEAKDDDAARQKALKKHYEWNTTEVTCKADGTISARINGVPISETKTELTQGPIGFQSEGARIHFRNIKIKMLD